MNPPFACRGVLTEAQERVLRLVASFPANLESAWDVPRELSLPGLAERLGVVRSALNPPLKWLETEGLVSSRQAHVIGGGTRKRTVIHATEEGRKLVDSMGETDVESRQGDGKIIGDAPSPTLLHGRENLVIETIDSLVENGSTQLVGIPGIGKTSLLREIAERWLVEHGDVRWVTIEAHHDMARTVATLLGISDAPKSIDAAIANLSEIKDSTLFVVDELQAVHERHSSAVTSLLEQLADVEGLHLLVGCRAPSPLDGLSSIKVEGLSEDDAMALLPDGLGDEVAAEVVSSLGGHPLALKLWDPGHSIPEADDRIQAFIQTDVIDALAEDGLTTMDELAAAPLPLLAAQLENEEGVGGLDEAALLRWSRERLELQHLVRNVRRAMWSEEEIAAIHGAAAEHWQQRIEAEAAIHAAHHLVQACQGEEGNLPEILKQSLAEMLSTDSAATAAILTDAMHALPSASSIRLLAAEVAIERGEGKVAESLITKEPETEDDRRDWLLLHSRLLKLRKKDDEANKAMAEALELSDEASRARLTIASAVNVLEDRLPGSLNPAAATKIQEMLKEIDVAPLDSIQRKSALVALASIRHSLALEEGDATEAARIRAELAATASEGDPLVEELAARAALTTGGEPARLEGLLARVENPLRKLAITLLLARYEHESGSGHLDQLLSQAEPPRDLGTTTARRLSAALWYWRGVADKSARVRHWQEALYRYSMAECPNAHAQLTKLLHEEMMRL